MWTVCDCLESKCEEAPGNRAAGVSCDRLWRVVRGGCTSLGAHPGSKPRLAWSRDCNDYEGMVVALLLVAAIAAIWWLVRHKGWGVVQKVVFWVVLLAVLWVLVTRWSPPHPGG